MYRRSKVPAKIAYGPFVGIDFAPNVPMVVISL